MAIIVATTYALDAIAQTEIRGKVRDWKTGEPLAFANVYINQTTLGAAADEKGQFVIHNVPPGNFELKASFVGYETESRKIIAGESAVLEANFGLNPLSKELTELEVTGTHDRKWQRKFRQFKREFLGVSPNASQCEIVNPWVVEFDEDNPGVWILRATASEPIEIINKALGYRLFFHIRRFEIYKTKIAILGDTRFEELKSDDEKEKERWNRQRRETWMGSERHLFYSMLHSRLEEDGFQIYAEISKNNDLVRSSMFSAELGKRVVPYTVHPQPIGKKIKLYRVPFDGRVEIHYSGRNDHPFYKDMNGLVSWIETAGQAIDVTDKGVVTDPSRLVTIGYFRSLRVADLLPLDYEPENLSGGSARH
ncbi:MAG: carboxypeptidase-like regulatory domain-containing protein [Cyclobacteriaceae bacterium]